MHDPVRWPHNGTKTRECVCVSVCWHNWGHFWNTHQFIGDKNDRSHLDFIILITYVLQHAFLSYNRHCTPLSLCIILNTALVQGYGTTSCTSPRFHNKFSDKSVSPLLVKYNKSVAFKVVIQAKCNPINNIFILLTCDYFYIFFQIPLYMLFYGPFTMVNMFHLQA